MSSDADYQTHNTSGGSASHGPLQTDVMTLGEVAAYLKVAERTVLRMVHNGEIPCAKVGGQWRFLRTVVDDWLLSRMSFSARARAEAEPESGTGESVAPTHRFSRFAHEERVLLDLPPELSKQAVLERLAGPLSRTGVVSDHDRFVSQLLEREGMVSTAVAPQVALPHIRRPDPDLVRGAAVCIGVSPEGIEFEALDGGRTRLFILLAAETEGVHLNLLAQAAAIVRDQETVDRLVAAASPADVPRVLIEADYRLLLSSR